MPTNEVESSAVESEHSDLTASDGGIKNVIFYLFLVNFLMPSPQAVTYPAMEGNESPRTGGGKGFLSWR